MWEHCCDMKNVNITVMIELQTQKCLGTGNMRFIDRDKF